MSINKGRNILYRLARILGDVEAVKRGRVESRIVGHGTGRLLGRLIR